MTLPTVLESPQDCNRLEAMHPVIRSPQRTLPHLAGTGVQVLIYMGQMRPASSSVGGSVDASLDSHTDFHLQQKIEYISGFNGNDYKKVVKLD